MAAFDDVHLPEDIESGALVGPQFSTTIVSMQGGKEQRNAEWEQERLTANIAYGVMKKNDERDITDSFAAILRFFRARRGKHRGFRFKDWSDYEADQIQLSPDSTGRNYQLVKYYEDYRRRITRPVPGTVLVSIGGAPPVAAGDTWTLNPLGIVQVRADLAYQPVVVDFQFDVPMRFDTDMAQVNLEWAEAGSISNIDLIQIRE